MNCVQHILVCKVCGCQFSTPHDLACHRRVCPKKPEWRLSPYGDGCMWLPINEDRRLADLVRVQGSVVLGDGTVTLNQKGTCLVKRLS